MGWQGEEARPAVSLRSETPPNPPLPGEVVLKSLSTTWLLPKCMTSPPPSIVWGGSELGNCLEGAWE